ncbi:hypothetical protein Pcinc_006531 [Petrolisthes cinctipes]|uniref:Phospholipase A2-like central domain-containing protein n=1 Tax=Petrolisthes cinctipes TaxID=88211 RepID=A0AAE1GAH5_PETCI|nr:hypothetical protein Pcinc_006531 [Petrolisthes cinctipes]
MGPCDPLPSRPPPTSLKKEEAVEEKEIGEEGGVGEKERGGQGRRGEDGHRKKRGRFKACLKLSKTGVADLVGEIFFNKMKTKCFDLVKKKVCTKRRGWLGFGPCIRYSYRRVAVLRDNVTYEY